MRTTLLASLASLMAGGCAQAPRLEVVPTRIITLQEALTEAITALSAAKNTAEHEGTDFGLRPCEMTVNFTLTTIEKSSANTETKIGAGPSPETPLTLGVVAGSTSSLEGNRNSQVTIKFESDYCRALAAGGSAVRVTGPGGRPLTIRVPSAPMAVDPRLGWSVSVPPDQARALEERLMPQQR